MSAKRLFDIFIGAAFLLAAAPLMALIAVLIRLSSPGPVLYRANRAGMNFERFTMYKFRTMRINRDRVREITARDDPRIFPFGKILRVMKLDELPQLINVLKGDMSLVGPRPEDYENAKRYLTGPYREVLRVRPGLTSPASLFDYTHGETVSSVDEYRSHCFYQKRDMDLIYIQNRNMAHDIKIMFQTAWTILCVCFGRKRFRHPRKYAAALTRQ